MARAKKKSIESLNDEIYFIIKRYIVLYCISIYPNPIFNNQSFKDETGKVTGKPQRGSNFQCCEVIYVQHLSMETSILLMLSEVTLWLDIWTIEKF